MNAAESWLVEMEREAEASRKSAADFEDVVDAAATVAEFFEWGERFEDPGTDESDEDVGPLPTSPGVQSDGDE